MPRRGVGGRKGKKPSRIECSEVPLSFLGDATVSGWVCAPEKDFGSFEVSRAKDVEDRGCQIHMQP